MGQQLAGAADASTAESWSKQFIAGDETVLGQLLAAWAPQITRRLARKYRGIFAEDQLEQIVLDALFAGWIKRQLFDPEKSSLMTWLNNVTEHLVADRAKSSWWKQRCRETSLANSKDNELSDEDFQTVDSGEDDLKSFQTPKMSGLLKALDGLTLRERDILMATTDETISSRDLGRELRISASTVRTYYQRAWEKVLRALRRAGFRVLEKGTNAGKGQKSDGGSTTQEAAAPRPRKRHRPNKLGIDTDV